MGATLWAQNAVSTFAGTVGQSGFVDTTPGPVKFSFTNPSAIAADSAGNLFVADANNNAIRKITAAGVVTTFAGSATGVAGNGDGTGTAAFFNKPQGIAIDGANNLYVADSNNHAIRKITSGGVVTTVAGTAGGANNSITVASGYVNDPSAANARFNTPHGLAVDRPGGGAAVNVYVADTQNHAIRKIVIGGAVTTLAGSTTANQSGNTNDPTGTNARFFHPDAIAIDGSAANLYVADTFNYLIRKVVISSTAVTTLAGTGVAGTYTEGVGTSAQFNNPAGIAVDGSSNVVVADTFFHIIRSINSTNGQTALYAGAANASGNTDGVATSARFNFPSGVAYDANSNSVFVVDTNNQTIRRISVAVAPSITTHPSNASKTAGQSATFTVVVANNTNPPPTYQWQRQAGGVGSFINISSGDTTFTGSTTATLTIPSVTTGMNNDKFQVVVTNTVGTATSNPATLTVLQPPVFTSGNSASFPVGSVTTFTVTTTGSPAATLSQTGNFPGFASFTNNGNGTATIQGGPTDATGSPFVFTISATNSAGTTNQTFTLTVTTGAAITTQPSNQSVSPGGTAVFTVGATSGSGSITYQWQRQAVNTVGFFNLSEGGTFTGTTTPNLIVSGASLSMHGDKFRVVVTGTIGSPVTSNEVTLNVVQAPAIMSAGTTTFTTGQFNSFTVQTTGSPTPTLSQTGPFPGFASFVDNGNGTATIQGAPTDTTGSPFQFTINATNSVTTASQIFTLVVSTAPTVPVISTHPVSATVAVGVNATFTAAATGTPTPTLRWQRQAAGTSGFVDLLVDDGTYSGTSTGTLTVINVQPGLSGDQYRLKATNSNGEAVSNPATLTVNLGTAISTFAGLAGAAGNLDGTGTSARFNTPASIAVDPSGNFYVADAANHTIRKITGAGVVTTFAGTPGLSGSLDGVGSAARFNGPSAVAVDGLGNVYVADTYNQIIRLITPSGTVSTLAGLANNSGSADGTGNTARFAFPGGIAADNSGNIYVSDTSNHTIRRVRQDGSVTTIAGAAGVSGAFDSGVATSARFAFPQGLALDISGNLYIADSFNHTIRKLTPFGSVQTVAGTAGASGSTDANGVLARFNQPLGVAVDSTGTIYVADTYNSTIRKIATSGDVTTLAGAAGQIGSTDGNGSQARFYQPFSITVDSNGNLFIADTRNQTIRRSGTTAAPAFTTQPQNTVGVASGSVTFTVVATGNPIPSYQWQRQPANTVGFVSISNDLNFSGVNSATLTVSNILSSFDGDQYRAVANNGVNPAATSNAAILTIGVPPAITSGAAASFRATEAGSFTVTATGTPTPTFSAANLPAWLSLNATTGVLSGTPPESAVGTLTLTITASNGAAASQTFTLTVLPAVVAPAISNQPAVASVDQGGTATFSVTATGTAPLSYQWRRNGVAIAGANGNSFTVANAQPGAEGIYSVVVTNAAGSVTSAGAQLFVNTAPVFVVQPRAQVALANSNVTFTAAASGSANFTYQWRKNGIAIAGANGSSFTINGVSAADAGNYDVQVSNSLGSVISSLAQLTIVTGPTAPVITQQPASRTVVAGSGVTLVAAASGAPSPTYQWRKNGQNIGGANGATLSFTGVTANDAASYDVVISNSAGSVTSNPIALRVLARSYAGFYFGSYNASLGNFAIYVRDDNTGVFLSYLPGAAAPLMTLNLTVSDSGQFTFTQAAVGTAGNENEPARAAALSPSSVSGSIANDGTITGSIQGGASGSLTGGRSPATGSSQGFAGFYQAGAASNGTVAYTIANANGQAFVVVQSGANSDGGLGSVSGTGQVTVPASRSIVLETISSSGTVAGSSTGGIIASFAGGSDAVNGRQRLLNISSRARVGTADSVAIAGFVISGEESKPVLIRAVGPTLGTAFNIAGALASPRLELFNSKNASLAVNTGIGTGTGRAAVDAAGVQSGAFPLGSAGTDAAILTTLAPGAYTAVVNSTTSTAGIALIEVYDLSAATPGQKLLNISTRAAAGTVEATLTAGFVIPPGPAKRVLVRGIGPGLSSFGVAGVLAQPILTVLNGGTTVATNTGYVNSADRADILTASAQVGGFPPASADSAVLVTLPAGNYTAQVVGPANATGVALIEVYEVP